MKSPSRSQGDLEIKIAAILGGISLTFIGAGYLYFVMV